MSRIDPNNVAVLVRDSSDQIVRIGVADWRELTTVVVTDQADDQKRFKYVEAQMVKAMHAGVASS